MFKKLIDDIQKNFSMHHQRILIFSLVSNLLLIVVVGVLLYPHDSLFQSRLSTDNIIFESSHSNDNEGFYVEILGQVKNPGVYYIRNKTLVLQVLDLAGGITSDADLSYIHKSIYLSKYVEPQQKIYIPAQNESIVTSSIQSSNVLISINQATQSELENLSGVGSVTAQKIIAGRPYSRIGDLVEMRIVTQGVYDKIVSQIAL
jgi:competence protein ComEA